MQQNTKQSRYLRNQKNPQYSIVMFRNGLEYYYVMEFCNFRWV